MRTRLANAIRLLAKEKLVELHGHASIRDPESGRIWILGHIHNGETLPKHATEEDLVEVSLEAEKVAGHWDPPEETPIHTEIYRAHPWANGVVHAHPRHCIALSAVGRTVLPIWTKAKAFAPAVPLWRCADHIETQEQGRELVRQLGDAVALLLQGHGVVTVGRSIEEATLLAILLEETAVLQTMVAGLGELEPMKLVRDAPKLERPGLGGGMLEGLWRYYQER